LEPNPIIANIPYLSSDTISVDTLRLDQIHPIISGNKWYKLRYYLKEAKLNNAIKIASFGGPFSNHLVALAYVAKLNGLKSIGYVRSNDNENLTPSLQEAVSYGMELIFLGRQKFQEKKNKLIEANKTSADKQTYFIDEGGYGLTGAKGAATIISDWNHISTGNPIHKYNSIICAVGTGTMIAGILNTSNENQRVIGISVLKNEGTIKAEIQNLLTNKTKPFELLHSFHHGGYAKTTPVQIAFMNELWKNSKIPTDIVYTGKIFYAVHQLLLSNYFPTGSKVLVIHSGGLQGNRSLEKGVLNF
jgi:1-aminocyclopropane-1-carboxylate deaminase